MNVTKILSLRLLAGFTLLVWSAALAKPTTYTLPDDTAQLRFGKGPGFEAAQNNCMACHSVDYISTQPPKLGKAFWEGEVTKMIKVYHAPIDQADVTAIAEYLAQAY
jgi:mono/diheme cytochrome c family protein